MLIFESGDLGLNPSGVWFESGDDSYFVKGKNEYLLAMFLYGWQPVVALQSNIEKHYIHVSNDGKKVLF